jgi:hypothetical protein
MVGYIRGRCFVLLFVFSSSFLSLRNLCIYSTNITFVLRYVIGLILDLESGLNHLIVHSHEYLLLRSYLGCIPWHHSPSPIVPVIRAVDYAKPGI